MASINIAHNDETTVQSWSNDYINSHLEVVADYTVTRASREELIAKSIDMSILLLGDVCFATQFGKKGRFHDFYQEEGSSYFFDGVRSYFNEADFVIANLENVFTTTESYQSGKIYIYKADPMYIEALVNSGITHVAVVNNHMADYQQQGFDESIQHLENHNIGWFGTNEYKTSNIELGNIFVDKKEILEKDGLRVGLLSYFGFYTSFATDEIIDRDISFLKKDKQVDYIIVYIHWGGQKTHEVNPKQKEMGHKLVDKGADLVIGGHPHVLQEMEIYNGKHIYYSLGDFLFVDRRVPQDYDSVMIKLQLSLDADGQLQEAFSYIPTIWSGNKTSNILRPQEMTDEEDMDRVFKKLKLRDFWEQILSN